MRSVFSGLVFAAILTGCTASTPSSQSLLNCPGTGVGTVAPEWLSNRREKCDEILDRAVEIILRNKMLAESTVPSPAEMEERRGFYLRALKAQMGDEFYAACFREMKISDVYCALNAKTLEAMQDCVAGPSTRP